MLKYISNPVIYKWGIGKFFMNDEQQTNFLDISGANAVHSIHCTRLDSYTLAN